MIAKNLTIAIPASIISDTPHLREKTAKVGLIGRAAAVFRVQNIIIYPDRNETDQRKEIDLVTTILRYMQTPQYLRKRLFKLDSKLKFAGILPPLQTPNHPIKSKSRKLQIGEYRDGVVLSKEKDGFFIDIGVEKLSLLREMNYQVGDIVTTQIIKKDKHIEVQSVDKNEIPFYWGFSVITEKNSFGTIVLDKEFDLIIATSKKGTNFVQCMKEFATRWKSANNIIIEFGSPNRGLFEIAKDEGIDLIKHAEFIINTIPHQGTKTIRTEEAIFSSLAIFNLNTN